LHSAPRAFRIGAFWPAGSAQHTPGTPISGGLSRAARDLAFTHRSRDRTAESAIEAVRRCQESDPAFPSLTAHDLRHTAASLAIHAGANPKVVQRMLGHASAAMTLDVYADLFESDLDAVAENVATTGRGPLICAGHLPKR